MCINQKIVDDFVKNKIEFVTTVPCKQLAGVIDKMEASNDIFHIPSNKEDEGITEDQVLWTIHYYLQNRKAYDLYLETHASRMRAEGLKLFKGCFTATRRLLQQYENT